MGKIKTYFWLFTAVALLTIPSCSLGDKTTLEKKSKSAGTELTRIMKSGKLRAVVDYNSTNYFIYRGKPMGFKYELLQHLANDMGIRLEISVSNNLQETFEGLNKKRYDLIAKNLTVTRNRNELIEFTIPLEQTRQVLVQRKPEQWKEMTPMAIEDSLIRNQLDLAGKRIHVQKNTAYYKRLVNLSDEIGGEIEIVQDSIFGVEQLVAMVAKGEIEYTVCDENVARVNQSYYPNLDVETPVSFPQNIAWAVRHDSPEWLNYLNNWILNFKSTPTYKALYKKYFENSRSSAMANSDYHSITGGKISPFDDLIKQESEMAGLDWRLVAAVIYQESRFDPTAESWAGAYGLMQILPESADMFNIFDYEEPRNNIKVGINLIKWLERNFIQEIPDSVERMKFVLAAYNVGLGHVKDAQRLAEKYNKIPIVWTNNVDYFLLNKSAAKFYKDPVVKWGYCRGEEPYQYVNKVTNTYRHYANIIGK
ncbi:transporter substrate-binding domain-containing protein [Gaoshiqia sediminis]|uniref:Transporter substrate-binding domain-containing protein n=1 Tax=Gaoshiqia sediminis TaxID=2986998 RepID=A0AA42C8D4_9BACT|nr:transporter substrate-binding domain-containing protein [Gaoshiqia sediminis]MCW0482596.1 transporter substrate-binding domain-containing protein [Gaoshiqia sediminis]